MELRQLGEQDAEEGRCVDYKMCRVVFGIKAGEEVTGRETEAGLVLWPSSPQLG